MKSAASSGRASAAGSHEQSRTMGIPSASRQPLQVDQRGAGRAAEDPGGLISAHLETGHYFNPHAQRITQARENGAKVIVLDTRLSNTATHADYWLSPSRAARRP